VLARYLALRARHGERRETFIETVRRVGLDPFKAAADTVRSTAEDLA
jgi:sulfite reductase (NADPH) hemoprotein beta-component